MSSSVYVFSSSVTSKFFISSAVAERAMIETRKKQVVGTQLHHPRTRLADQRRAKGFERLLRMSLPLLWLLLHCIVRVVLVERPLEDDSVGAAERDELRVVVQPLQRHHQIGVLGVCHPWILRHGRVVAQAHRRKVVARDGEPVVLGDGHGVEVDAVPLVARAEQPVGPVSTNPMAVHRHDPKYATLRQTHRYALFTQLNFSHNQHKPAFHQTHISTHSTQTRQHTISKIVILEEMDVDVHGAKGQQVAVAAPRAAAGRW